MNNTGLIFNEIQENTMKRIEANARTVRELLQGAKFSIDFYQREFAWQERQIRELIDDLTGRFLDFFDPEHARHEVESCGHSLHAAHIHPKVQLRHDPHTTG